MPEGQILTLLYLERRQHFLFQGEKTNGRLLFKKQQTMEDKKADLSIFLSTS
jgi:hypothetical protein